ncbi:MAG: hypothetical protein ACXWE9_07525 [Methylobacter sp.]
MARVSLSLDRGQSIAGKCPVEAVVIGCSAGGLDALRILLDALPA